MPRKYDTVTSWSARKAHYTLPDQGYTLCHTVAVRPGDLHVGPAISEESIRNMDVCGRCARKAVKLELAEE